MPISQPWLLKFKSDYWEEFLPFSFKGFGLEAQCFLRISVLNNRCLVLVAQLPDYLGTDVTTGFDEIFEALAVRLAELDCVEVSAIPSSGLSWLLRRLGLRRNRPADTNKRLEAAKAYCMTADWVVCYPPGVGLISNESFAVIRIDEERNYFFNYRKKENILSQLNISETDLSIDYGKLEDFIGILPAEPRKQPF